MKSATRHGFTALLLVLSGAISVCPANAQNQQLQQRVEEIKQSAAKKSRPLRTTLGSSSSRSASKANRKSRSALRCALALTESHKRPRWAHRSRQSSNQGGRRGGRLKEHVVAKKTEEYKDDADQMKTLAQQYVPPSKELLQQAYQQGNIALNPGAGAPSEVQLVIRNYLKPQDLLTLVFDKTQKALLRDQVASYMSDPKDAMNLKVQFSRLPDGTNYVSNMVIDGASKQLNIAIQNSHYQRL